MHSFACIICMQWERQVSGKVMGWVGVGGSGPWLSPCVGELVVVVDGQPKVGDLDVEGVGQQDVLRLDVAVGDALGARAAGRDEMAQRAAGREGMQQTPAAANSAEQPVMAVMCCSDVLVTTLP
jgi:hypothetical protein